jgi:hypothetical protein
MKGKIMELLKNKTVTTVCAIVAAGLMFIFGSWMTSKTLEENLDGYKNYTIDQVVSNVLEKEGGVIDQLKEIKDIAIEGRDISIQTRDAAHDDWIIDIQKYYKRLKNEKLDQVSRENIELAKNHWGKMSESEKNSLLTNQYNYILSRYDDVE